MTPILIPSESQIDDAVTQILPTIVQHSCVCFSGEMGAGKTTIIKAICKRLGVESGLSSPTYGLVNEYHTNSGEVLYHLDLYRLNNADELLDIGWEDYEASGNLMLIEWPEMAEAHLPRRRAVVELETAPEGRLLTLTEYL